MSSSSSTKQTKNNSNVLTSISDSGEALPTEAENSRNTRIEKQTTGSRNTKVS